MSRASTAASSSSSGSTIYQRPARSQEQTRKVNQQLFTLDEKTLEGQMKTLSSTTRNVRAAKKICRHKDPIHTLLLAMSIIRPSSAFRCRAAAPRRFRAVAQVFIGVFALALLAAADPADAVLVSGPAGHTLSAPLTVLGDVSVVSADGSTNDLLQIIQQQATLIASQAILIQGQSTEISLLKRERPLVIITGLPTSAVTADAVERVVLWPTKTNDTSNAYSTSTGAFTAPVSGIYLTTMNLCVHTSPTTTVSVLLYLDDVLYRYATVAVASSSDASPSITAHIPMTSGQSITYRIYVVPGANSYAPTWCVDPHGHFLSIQAITLS